VASLEFNVTSHPPALAGYPLPCRAPLGLNRFVLKRLVTLVT
jgi:hypothetical protein